MLAGLQREGFQERLLVSLACGDREIVVHSGLEAAYQSSIDISDINVPFE